MIFYARGPGYLAEESETTQVGAYLGLLRFDWRAAGNGPFWAIWPCRNLSDPATTGPPATVTATVPDALAAGSSLAINGSCPGSAQTRAVIKLGILADLTGTDRDLGGPLVKPCVRQAIQHIVGIG